MQSDSRQKPRVALCPWDGARSVEWNRRHPAAGVPLCPSRNRLNRLQKVLNTFTFGTCICTFSKTAE